MNTTDANRDFETFMTPRLEASTAFVNGDIGPLDAISAHVSPVTIFGPRAPRSRGRTRSMTRSATRVQLAAHHAVDSMSARPWAQSSEPGAETTFKVMHRCADEHLTH